MFPTQLALGLLAATTASAGQLAAWWTNDFGPALIMQDDASAGLRYSLCNSRGVPIFPNDTSITLPLLTSPPKNGTALTAGGWWDTKDIWASIFYLSQYDEIVNSLLKCDQKTGRWASTGEWVISKDAPRPANNSDLSVSLLGEKYGDRLLYNGADGAVHLLAWSLKTGWHYADIAYKGPTSANVIASVFPPADLNITFLVPRDNKNLGLGRFYSDNTWRIESFPTPLRQFQNQTIFTNNTNLTSMQLNTSFVPSYSLPAWDGKPKSMAMAEDSKWTRSVFYVGNDSQVYQVGNLDYKWLVFDRQESTAWPRSDTGYLAVANDFYSDSMRIYYMSNGKLIEANGDDGSWKPAQALPAFNTTATTNNSTETPNTGNSDLSSGAKAGIGVGVTLGVIAVVGIIAAVLLFKRRQKKRHEAEAAAAAPAAGGSPAYGNELGGESKSPDMAYSSPGELHSNHTGTTAGYSNYQPNQVYHELPAQQRHAEMMGEGHYKEAP